MTTFSQPHQSIDTRPGGSDRLAKLAQRATEAAAIRAHQTHPDVIALAVEKVRTQVDVLLWVAIVAGLGFTMVNVQQFAAQDTTTSAAWWTAWLLDPMVSLALLAVLRAEQVTARYQVRLNWWAHLTKWLTFAATYTMNTWQSWAHASAAGVVLHSVPPLVVFAAAEAGPGLRDRLTEAVRAALAEAQAAQHTEHPEPATVATPDHAAEGVHESEGAAGTPTRAAPPDVETNQAHGEDPAASQPAPRRPARAGKPSPRTRKRTKGRTPTPRRLRADYLAEARARLTDLAPGQEPTSQWVRQVTGCGHTLSSELAATLRAEHASSTPIRRAKAA